MELLESFEEFEYPNEIGPGVYDIHSPNVPSVEWIGSTAGESGAAYPGRASVVNRTVVPETAAGRKPAPRWLTW